MAREARRRRAPLRPVLRAVLISAALSALFLSEKGELFARNIVLWREGPLFQGKDWPDFRTLWDYKPEPPPFLGEYGPQSWGSPRRGPSSSSSIPAFVTAEGRRRSRGRPRFSGATPCHPERRGAGRNEPRALIWFGRLAPDFCP